MYKLLAILNGSIIAVMILVNGLLANTVGQYTSLTIIHLVGLFSILLIFFIKQKNVISIKGIPPYLLSAGAIGIFNVYFENICFPKLGVTLTITLGLFGQLITSCIIDHFGLFGMTTYRFNLKRLPSLVMISFGIIIMLIM